MPKILIIAKWEYLTRIRSKWFVISTLIIPLVLVAFMFIPALMVEESGMSLKILGLIDDSGRIGPHFDAVISAEYQLKDGQPKYQIVDLTGYPGEDARTVASSLLDSALIDAYLYIPENVLESGQVRYYARFLGDYRDQEEIRQALNRVMLNLRARDVGLEPELIRELTSPVTLTTIEVKKGGKQSEGSEFVAYVAPIVFVLMLYFAIVMSAQVLMRSVLEERSNRLVEILLSSVSSTQLMSGKIIGLGLLGLSQLGFYLVCGLLVSQHRGMNLMNAGQLPYFLLYFVLGYLFFSGIYAAIGALFSSEHDAQQVVSVISIISVVPILLASYVIANPESLLTILLSHIPFLTPFFMILLMGIETPPVWHLISTIIVLVVCSGLTMIAAGKIFRTAVLMYGKRPTFPEIWQWLKSA
ncbi:MAG: ABC transporter permease [Fidelibacterota bacterium]